MNFGGTWRRSFGAIGAAAGTIDQKGQVTRDGPSAGASN